VQRGVVQCSAALCSAAHMQTGAYVATLLQQCGTTDTLLQKCNSVAIKIPQWQECNSVATLLQHMQICEYVNVLQ
jgi:hypothetical protein